jgi:hypothetical protein
VLRRQGVYCPPNVIVPHWFAFTAISAGCTILHSGESENRNFIPFSLYKKLMGDMVFVFRSRKITEKIGFFLDSRYNLR